MGLGLRWGQARGVDRGIEGSCCVGGGGVRLGFFRRCTVGKKCEKLLKKKRSSKFFGREKEEVSVVKKDRQIFWTPHCRLARP
jgi:hypothetical protein